MFFPVEWAWVERHFHAEEPETPVRDPSFPQFPQWDCRCKIDLAAQTQAISETKLTRKKLSHVTGDCDRRLSDREELIDDGSGSHEEHRNYPSTDRT